MSAQPDIDWEAATKFVKRLLKTQATRSAGLHRLTMTNIDASLSCAVAVGWRKHRFYKGEGFIWSGVRQRRHGGLLFQLSEPLLSHPGRLTKLKEAGFTVAEADYPLMSKTFAGFDAAFAEVCGGSYEVLLSRFTTGGGAQHHPAELDNAISVAAMVDLYADDPIFGSW